MSPDQPALAASPQTPDAAPLEALAPPVIASRVSRRGKRRSVRPLIFAIVGLAAIGGAVFWWLSTRNYESTDDAFIDVHMVRVAPQVAGRVALVAVDDNQSVKASQLLVRIDPAPFQAKLAQAVANQANAAGSLAQAKAQRAVVEADAARAQAQVGVAQANASNAVIALKRSQGLIASTAFSRQQFDDATANAASTAATLVAAQKNQISSEAQLAVTDSRIETAQAALDSAKAQVEQARLDLSYTEIFASDAGTITHKNVSPGDYVQVGQILAALVPLDVWITANFKESQLALMRVGQPVAITIDAYPDKTFHGHIDSFQRGSGPAFSLLPPENATGNYVKVVQRVPVKIVFDDPLDPSRPLGPGMSVVPSVKVR
jgi:membrane fusion protein (multidrug efflux system)